MKLVGHWCLGLLLGLASGGLPLVGAQMSGSQVDPFDHGISYLVWVGGSFLAGFGMTYVRPQQAWLCGLSVLSGFLAAMVLEIVIDSHTGRVSHNLWPLTLAFSVLIGAPPAFAGAYFSSKLRRKRAVEQ
jgi:hypothetical protein